MFFSYTTSIVYEIGDVITNGIDTYVCKVGHTAGATFGGDSANWDNVLEDTVQSKNGAGGTGSVRISTMVSITQIAYNNLATPRPADCLYIIKG